MYSTFGLEFLRKVSPVYRRTPLLAPIALTVALLYILGTEIVAQLYVTRTDPVVQPPALGITVPAVVVRVLDGDTIVVRSGLEYRIRLLDCWTPESRQDSRVTPAQQERSKQLGLAAKARLEAVCPPGTPVIVTIPVNDDGDLSESMTLNRFLGRVWVNQKKPDLPSGDVSAILVREGHAYPTKEALAAALGGFVR